MLTYGMLVKVIAGFYVGCTGVVVDSTPASFLYQVDMTCKWKNGHLERKIVWVRDEQLKELK